MTTGEKIAKQRKENNFTQEQLAEILGVSRQSVSKWESDIAYPETEKLIRLGKLFHCSLDYLLNEECLEPSGGGTVQAVSVLDRLRDTLKKQCRERKSEKILFGMPLYHIGRNAHGFFAIGWKARGIFAVGLYAQGMVSLGVLSIGILSAGLLSLGVLCVGTLALGLLAAGAVSLGVISFGALSIGAFSAGAFAIGKYIAVGDYAQAMIAIGDSTAQGTVYQHLTTMAVGIPYVKAHAEALLDENVPQFLSWAKSIFTLYLR